MPPLFMAAERQSGPRGNAFAILSFLVTLDGLEPKEIRVTSSAIIWKVCWVTRRFSFLIIKELSCRLSTSQYAAAASEARLQRKKAMPSIYDFVERNHS